MSFFTNIWERMRDAYAYRNEPEYTTVLTRVYWYSLLTMTALVIALAVAGGIFMLFYARGDFEDPSLVVSNGAGALKLNTAQLKSTIDAFSARRAQYDSLKTSPENVTDPSK